MDQTMVIKPVEMGECIICRVVISGLSQSFMNVQGGVNLTKVGQEYQLYVQKVNGTIPDVIISETVKASFNKVLPAVQFKAVLPATSADVSGWNFRNMAEHMLRTFCSPTAGTGEAIVTIGSKEIKMLASAAPASNVTRPEGLGAVII